MTDTALWVFLSVIASATVAGMAIISERHHLPTTPRLFWLRLFSFGTMLPFALVIDWPDNPLFYACMVGITLLICISDILYYGSARDNGAGPTSRIEPLSVLLTFVAWSALVPSQLRSYMDRPAVALGIAACFAVAGYCAMHLRRHPVSRETLRKLMPVVIIMAAVSILGKTGMDLGGRPVDAAIAYITMQAGMLMLFYGGITIAVPQRAGSLRPNRLLLASAGMMAACSVVHIASKNIAYTYVSNPAYVTVIGLTAPLFVAAYYRVIGRRDDAAVWAGFGIVISAAALIGFTRF